MSGIDSALSLLAPGWVGSLIGIVSFIGAVLIYLWTRKRTQIGYVYTGEHLLGSASDALPPAIVVEYDGTSIPRLTKSLVFLWNTGENTVLGEDIVDKDPLRFSIGSDGKILSVSVLKASRAVNDFRVALPSDDSPNEAAFNFNFLDSKDGVAVEILHTSTDRRPKVKGTLRGLPQGFRNLGRINPPKPVKPGKYHRFGRAMTTWVPVVAGGTVMLLAFFTSFFSFIPDPNRFGLLLFSAFGAYTGMALTNLLGNRRRYPKSLELEPQE